jgi:hypothetical protein
MEGKRKEEEEKTKEENKKSTFCFHLRESGPLPLDPRGGQISVWRNPCAGFQNHMAFTT